MKTAIGESGLKESYQDEFEKEVPCVKCSGVARIAFVAYETGEEKELICRLRPNGGKGDFWLHDCCSVAVYLCKDCLEATAIINQA